MNINFRRADGFVVKENLLSQEKLEQNRKEKCPSNKIESITKMIVTNTFKVSLILRRVILNLFRGTAATACTIHILTVAHTHFLLSFSLALCRWCIFKYTIDLSVIMQEKKVCCQQSLHNTYTPHFSRYFWWSTAPFCWFCRCFGLNRWLFFCVPGYLIFCRILTTQQQIFSRTSGGRKCFINCVYAVRAKTTTASVAALAPPTTNT